MLAHWKKSYDQHRQHIKKQRHYFANKIHLAFPVVMYVCRSWTIKKTEIMASGPIISWKIDGETMETVRDFILGGSKITADGDCGHEIKRHLLLGSKPMTTLTAH